MLLDARVLEQRRQLAAGALKPLADSLARDLERLTRSTTIYVPAQKARLTRVGGRCPTCGSALDFDPWNRHAHRCPRCHIDVTGAEHDGMWIMWYQLWLAERAVHAAALYATRGDEAHRRLAERILTEYGEQYLKYPNRDNVLGPTRPFFSTYLESIWTLQLACALDVLESAAGQTTLGETVRERVLRPSVQVIAEYDEGLSNRQVWNNAALLACGSLLGDEALRHRAIYGASGLVTHLERGLLGDGTWYEGENYHLFAHRGLWYSVTLCDVAGCEIPAPLRQRYMRAFETPFLTALPDFTFPARRDSQYRVSLRQWRIAETCELGLAAGPSHALEGALRELYRADIASGDTGRARSTAEAERNVPAARLTRADLGWKSLLFAQERLPDSKSVPNPTSVLLMEQGLAILRRDGGRTYVALDYGETGGGHGHPDRLNVWLVHDDARILEDVGTGSYVDPSLHWYRSTLAHNAPLAGARSQRPLRGDLLAYDERGEFGWTVAGASIAPNVDVERAVVAGPGYLIDETSWQGPDDTIVDCPYHIAGEAPSVTQWTAAPIAGASGLEDGFRFVSESAHAPPAKSALIVARLGPVTARLWLQGDEPFVLWRLRAPGPPNEPPRHFFLLRTASVSGRIRAVIAWDDAVTDARAEGEQLLVTVGGATHIHQRVGFAWHIDAGDMERATLTSISSFQPSVSVLVEVRPPTLVDIPRVAQIQEAPGELALDRVPARRFVLDAEHYRRSEQTWQQAGSPRATVALAATANELHIDVAVDKQPLQFAPPRAENPLDNEHPDVNSDGIQAHLGTWAWLLVPEEPSPNVRVTLRRSGDLPAPPITARWRATATGYSMRITLPLDRVTNTDGTISGDVIVNEISPDRERRRGQLVLSGGRGEWVYLRGDRQEPMRFVRFRIVDA